MFQCMIYISSSSLPPPPPPPHLPPNIHSHTHTQNEKQERRKHLIIFFLLLRCCRWEAICLWMGKVWAYLCSVRRAISTHENPHRGETVPLPVLWSQVYAQWPPGQTHAQTHHKRIDYYVIANFFLSWHLTLPVTVGFIQGVSFTIGPWDRFLPQEKGRSNCLWKKHVFMDVIKAWRHCPAKDSSACATSHELCDKNWQEEKWTWEQYFTHEKKRKNSLIY